MNISERRKAMATRAGGRPGGLCWWTGCAAGLVFVWALGGCQSAREAGINESGSAKAGAAAATYEAPLDVRRPGDVRFSSEPAVEKRGGGWRIAFAVSAPTDVEVAVLDAKGKVVRHLAAGLLGANAPAPLQKGSLRQELVWDGKNDLGDLPPSTVHPPPFSVRVRLGSTPRLEKTAGFDGNTFGLAISGLAVGKDGELFVMISNTYRGRSEVRALDREGRYLRTVLPYPADTPRERTKSLGQLEVDGELLPIVNHYQSQSLAPMTGGLRRQNMAWSPRGHLVVVGAMGSVFDQGGPRHLLALHPQGGAPEGLDFVGPRFERPAGLRYSSGLGWNACFDHVAISPDGKWTYLTLSTWQSPHCVFRLDASRWSRGDECLAPEMEEGFAGRVNRPGAGEDRLNDPQGLAVDAKGNVYVCDRGNDRVAVFSDEGKFLAAIPVPSPEQIGVHRTGEIYVLSRRRLSARQERDFSEMDMGEYKAWLAREDSRKKEAGPEKPPRLVKFSALGGGEAKELASVEGSFDLIALDPESSPARIWASTTAEFPGLTRSDRLYYPEGSTRGELLSVTERDGKLEIGAPVSNQNGLRFPWFVAADPARGRVLIREHSPHPPFEKEAPLRAGYKTIVSLDLKTGKIAPFADAAEVVTGPDGTVYAIGPFAGGTIRRLDPSGNPSPVPGGASAGIATGPFTIYANSRTAARGFCIAPDGDIYLIRANKTAPERGTFSRVDIYSPDGKLKKAAVVDGLDAADCGIGVDVAGNIYLGANLHPAGQPFPKGFGGLIPAENWSGWRGAGSRGFPWDYLCANYYLFAWGAVLRFGPEGGACYGRGSVWHRPKPDDSPLASAAHAPAGATRYRSPALDKEVAVRGAHWRFPGVGPVPTTAVNYGDATCMCTTSRLAVDPWGRVFAPDVFRFSVWMLDTNGNLLHRIGRYGNTDDASRGLRFAWPSFVDEAEGQVYVLDNLNRRVTVVGFDYAADRECAIP